MPIHNKSKNKPIESQIKDSKIERVNWRYVKKEFGNLFFLEKGFGFTILELTKRPAKTIQSYLFEDRKKYTKPITFLILSALIYTIVHSFLFSGDSSVANNIEDPFVSFMDWQDNNWGYSLIFASVFSALWIRLFFNKKPYNIFEIFIANVYIYGMMILWTTIGDVLSQIFKNSLTGDILGIIFMSGLFLYMVWALGTFLQTNRFGFIKVFLSIILGLFSLIIVGSLIILTLQNIL